MNRKILVIDDEEVIQTLIKKILSPRKKGIHLSANRIFTDNTPLETDAPYFIDTAEQGEEGYQKIKNAIQDSSPYCLAFVDVRMPPGWDGIKTAQEIKKLDPDIFIVFVTAHSDKKIDEIYCQIGRKDRIMMIKKPFDTEEIKSIAEMAVRAYDREAALKELAYRDGLTGLMNRRLFIHSMQQELERTRRHSMRLSLLMLDIDHFKMLNDTYGHAAGDEGLIQVASLLQESMRSSDLCGRFGGEEFIVLLPQTDLKKAYEIAERIRLAVQDLKISWEVHELTVTVSIGCTESNASSGDTVETIIARADKALYQAKEKNRNRVEYCAVDNI